MSRGRPVRSDIRQNMIEILFYLNEAYGYEIYKVYKEVFPEVSLRSMYYHLKKGVSLNEFKKVRVDSDSGEFSWGPSSERIVYCLGDAAKPRGDVRVESFIASKS